MNSGTPSNPARPLGGPGSRGWGKRKGLTFVGGKVRRVRPIAKEGDLFGVAPAAKPKPKPRRPR